MPSEKFIIVSLEDEKSKDLANVISNDTSRRILSFLSEKEASESDISKALGLPPSTVHYNVQHLLKNNLIEVKDFYWSDKGNKVNIYTIAKKLIVIAPKGAKVTSAIKSLIPVALISLAAAAVIHFVSNRVNAPLAISQGAGDLMRTGVPEAAEAPAKEAAIEQTVVTLAQPTFWSTIFSNYSVWFLLGAVFAIIIYLIIYFVRRKK
ncbi:MAG: helix-turn-helix domain-containing protein [archaeon]